MLTVLVDLHRLRASRPALAALNASDPHVTVLVIHAPTATAARIHAGEVTCAWQPWPLPGLAPTPTEPGWITQLRNTLTHLTGEPE